MTRPLRLEFPNAVYHITARGNEKGEIFLDGEDREKFLFYLEVVQERYKALIYSFVLMGNHYHLLLETTSPNLSRLMRDLNGHYTLYFNKRHDRNGHLFQGRYKSILVDREAYLLELSRYIHLNPVRSGIAGRPQEHEYSSVHYYFGILTPPPWLNVDLILAQFGNNIAEQRRAYKKFVYDGINNPEDPLKNVHAGALLGSEAFINRIKESLLTGKQISKEVPASKELKYGLDLNGIAKMVLRYYNTDISVLSKKKIKFNRVRKAFVYFSRKYTASTLDELRRFLNNSITEGAISKLFSRTEEELKKENGLEREIEEIEEQLFSRNDMYQVKT